MAVKICSAVIPAFPARRTAMWMPPLTIVWAPMYRVMPLAAASTLPCASPEGRMGFAPVQRTITRHTNDPEQMTVDLQLGGAPLAGSGRRHADGGERGDDARRGIWEYRTGHRRRGKAATPRAVGDSTSGHSRPARERQHQRGKAISGNAERHAQRQIPSRYPTRSGLPAESLGVFHQTLILLRSSAIHGAIAGTSSGVACPRWSKMCPVTRESTIPILGVVEFGSSNTTTTLSPCAATLAIEGELP